MTAPTVDYIKVYDRTDLGNTQKFGDTYAGGIRYDHLKERWLIWDEHFWKPDYGPLLTQHVMTFVLNEYFSATQAEATKEPKERRETIHWGQANSERGMNAIARLASNLPILADTGEDWDTIPYLLGVPNGVVDLRTGELRDGHPDDRITMQARVPYDPLATCARWERFLTEIHPDDYDGVAVREYLHRSYGYSTTGESRDHVIFYLIGRGRNGKSVERNTINWLLGSYGHVLPFTSLEYSKQPRASNDMADLFRKRMAISSEANKNVRLDTARIKTLTGEDEIRPRFLYREAFTFMNTAKIWVAVNDKPSVADDSDGFWERVKVALYPESFPEGAEQTDNNLRQLFREEEAMGILKWLIDGAVKYYQGGLGTVPESIARHTQTYREENDPLAEFIDAMCGRSPNDKVTITGFFNAYVAWAHAQGYSDRETKQRKEVRGYLLTHFTEYNWNKGRGVKGVRLLSEPPAPDDLGLDAAPINAEPTGLSPADLDWWETDDEGTAP